MGSPLGPRAPRGRLARRGPPVRKDRLELLVPPDRLDLKGNQALLARRGQKDRRDPRDQRGTLEPALTSRGRMIP